MKLTKWSKCDQCSMKVASSSTRSCWLPELACQFSWLCLPDNGFWSGWQINGRVVVASWKWNAEMAVCFSLCSDLGVCLSCLCPLSYEGFWWGWIILSVMEGWRAIDIIVIVAFVKSWKGMSFEEVFFPVRTNWHLYKHELTLLLLMWMCYLRYVWVCVEDAKLQIWVYSLD